MVEQNSDLGGAKGTRTPGLLDANHIFCVFLRRSTSPDDPSTCGDCRRLSVGVARSRTPLALCLALLRHPSGLGDAARGASGSTCAASPQVVVMGFPASHDRETAGEGTNCRHLALARFSYEASWQVPPDTAETRCSVHPKSTSRCRVAPFFRQGGALRAAAGPASAAASGLGRPRPPHAGPRRKSRHIDTAHSAHPRMHAPGSTADPARGGAMSDQRRVITLAVISAASSEAK